MGLAALHGMDIISLTFSDLVNAHGQHWSYIITPSPCLGLPVISRLSIIFNIHLSSLCLFPCFRSPIDWTFWPVIRRPRQEHTALSRSSAISPMWIQNRLYCLPVSALPVDCVCFLPSFCSYLFIHSLLPPNPFFFYFYFFFFLSFVRLDSVRCGGVLDYKSLCPTIVYRTATSHASYLLSQ